MFRWYQIASVCYAFLSDVSTVFSLPNSRWFTRGWTLQELVAPRDVRFYNCTWKFVGSKLNLRKELHDITTIEEAVLVTGNFETISIARRMSWAAGRQTTRIEDRAYGLMGIFDVNMPLLYGEGHKAFARLQEAILKISDDQSLFAWGLPAVIKTVHEVRYDRAALSVYGLRGIFAESPDEFKFSERIHVLQDLQFSIPPIVSNNGVRIELQVYHPLDPLIQFAVLYCTIHGNYRAYLSFPIIKWGGRWVARCGELVLVAVSDLVHPSSATPYTKPEVLLLKAPTVLLEAPEPSNSINLVRPVGTHAKEYALEVHCAKHAAYAQLTGALTLTQDVDTIHAVFIFARMEIDPSTLFDRLSKPTSKGDSSDKVCHKSSFVTTTRSLTMSYRYTAVFPAFAVLVGGKIATPWVEVMIVLDDDDPLIEFQRLHAADAKLVQQCIEKKTLLALLEENKETAPVSDKYSQDVHQLIMLWEEAQAFRSGPFTEIYQKQLLVRARIQMVFRNLIEKGLMLSVTIAPPGDGADRVESEGLKWWSRK